MRALSRLRKGLIRRAHYALFDRRFDRSLGVDTHDVGFPNRLWHSGNYRYVSSPVLAFHWAMSTIGIDPARFVFVDLGSGKGRTLLIASRLPFLRIEGVEYAEDLHRSALLNIKSHAARVVAPIMVHHMDAAEYPIPPEPCVFYLFNPFGESVLARVLENVERSWRAAVRPIFFVYMNPTKKSVFAVARFLQPLRRSTLVRALDWATFPHDVAFYRTPVGP